MGYIDGNLEKIDLDKLFRKQSFTISSQVTYNRINISLFTLTNIGANSYLFFNIYYITKIAEFLKIFI